MTCLLNPEQFPIIYGFNNASEIGVNVFSPSIFLGRCNFNCPYCMNSKLVHPPITTGIDIEEVKKFVLEEKSKWLMISGGEPTCTSLENLVPLLEEISSWGCKIGMSTNGSNSTKLAYVLHYLSYVAIDIKGSNSDAYRLLTDDYMDAWKNLICSLKILETTKKIRAGFDYETRTTLYPRLLNPEAIHLIGHNLIMKKSRWALQQFRHAQNMLDGSCKEIKPYSDEELKSLKEIAQKYCDNVVLRYV
jgi:pyruvate-formate lyase-activating enzyme